MKEGRKERGKEEREKQEREEGKGAESEELYMYIVHCTCTLERKVYNDNTCKRQTWNSHFNSCQLNSWSLREFLDHGFQIS